LRATLGSSLPFKRQQFLLDKQKVVQGVTVCPACIMPCSSLQFKGRGQRRHSGLVSVAAARSTPYLSQVTPSAKQAVTVTARAAITCSWSCPRPHADSSSHENVHTMVLLKQLQRTRSLFLNVRGVHKTRGKSPAPSHCRWAPQASTASQGESPLWEPGVSEYCHLSHQTAGQ
jgi:hypothetical protein